MGAGFFLLLSLLTQFGFDRMIRDAGYPGSRMIPLPTPCSACSPSSVLLPARGFFFLFHIVDTKVGSNGIGTKYIYLIVWTK